MPRDKKGLIPYRFGDNRGNWLNLNGVLCHFRPYFLLLYTPRDQFIGSWKRDFFLLDNTWKFRVPELISSFCCPRRRQSFARIYFSQKRTPSGTYPYNSSLCGARMDRKSSRRGSYFLLCFHYHPHMLLVFDKTEAVWN